MSEIQDPTPLSMGGDMSPTKNPTLLTALIVVGILLLIPFGLRTKRKLEFDRRFDAVRLGSSPEETRQPVGEPDFVFEETHWLCQIGRDPYASLEFRAGRLYKMERGKEWLPISTH